MKQNDLLIEIGTEELPPVALKGLRDAFANSIEKQLKDAALNFASAERFASPRRLAVLLRSLDQQAPSQTLEAWGPPAKVAFDKEGNPTRAAEAFAQKNGLDIGELKNHIANDGKQDKLFVKNEQAGAQTTAIIFDVIEKA
uniref:glycine--tRNA ligase subunit beta n=1 Tax=Litorivivens sp. TaxID=2020868 RepID=UPI003563B754